MAPVVPAPVSVLPLVMFQASKNLSALSLKGGRLNGGVWGRAPI